MYFSDEFRNNIFRLGFLVTIILILLDLITFFYFTETKIGKIFLATREQTPLTWISATLLLLIGLVSMSNYLALKKRVWYFLSLSFLFFSMDDATYFHERFSAALQEFVPIMQNFPSYSWIVIYLPLLLFAFLTLGYFLYLNVSKPHRKFIILAGIFLSLSLALDMADGYVGKDASLVFCFDQVCNRNVTHLIRLLEEFLEVISLGILSYYILKTYGILKSSHNVS